MKDINEEESVIPDVPRSPDVSLADVMTRRAMDRYGPALDELKEREV